MVSTARMNDVVNCIPPSLNLWILIPDVYRKHCSTEQLQTVFFHYGVRGWGLENVSES